MADRLRFTKGQLFHMTLIEHLPAIIADGRLLCDVTLDGRTQGRSSIGHAHMKEKRRRIEVPVGPGGVVGDYVPFYLAPRSPMLFANHMGAVGDRSTGQDRIVYLVTNLERVTGLDGLVMTNQHPERRPVFTTDLAEFDEPGFIDWDVMFDRDFRPHDNYTDRTQRRQAEALVHHEVPLDVFLGLAARTVNELAEARAICEPSHPTWRFNDRPDWYF